MKKIQVTQHKPRRLDGIIYNRVKHRDVQDLGLIYSISEKSKISPEAIFLSSDDFKTFEKAAKIIAAEVEVDPEVKSFRYFPDMATYNPAFVGFNISPGTQFQYMDTPVIVKEIRNSHNSSKTLLLVAEEDLKENGKEPEMMVALGAKIYSHIKPESISSEMIIYNQIALHASEENSNLYKSPVVEDVTPEAPTQSNAQTPKP